MENKSARLNEQIIMKSVTPLLRYKDGEDVKAWQEIAGKKLHELLKLDAMKKVPPEIKIEYTKDRGDFTETRFLLRSEESFWLPCHYWRPKKSGKLTTVICIQGHSTGMHISMGRIIYERDAASISGGDRDFAVRVIKEGYSAVMMEQRGMGECDGEADGPKCHVGAMSALINGRTMIGERVWDVMRLIDALLDNFGEEVDEDKIVIMGNSGGGTTSFYAGCVDQRISYVMPSCAVATYSGSIGAMEHCVCNFIPDIAKYFDMGDLAGLIAPRPLVVVSGKEDPIFPIDTAKECVKEAARIYSALGAADKCRHVIGNGGHRFYANDAWPVMNELLG